MTDLATGLPAPPDALAVPAVPTELVEPESEAGSEGHVRRLRTITIDQALSSGSNILITIFAARTLSATAFGYFGVAFLVYMMIQGVSRALVAEPLLVLPKESEERPGEAIGTAALLGLGIGVLVAGIALVTRFWDADLSRGLLALALFTPLLILQDLGRYLAFAVHRPGRAVVLDAVWLVLLVGAVGFLGATETDSLVWFITAWAGTGAIAGLVLFVQYRSAAFAPTLGWLRQTWPFSWRYALSYASRQGSVLIVSSTLAGVLGPKSLGALRGALLLFGPFQQLQVAAVAAGVSEISRVEGRSRELARHVRRTTALTGAMALLNMGVALALTDRLGMLVLGDTWKATHPLLLPAGLQMLLIALISGVRSALLGLGKTTTAVRIDIATAVGDSSATLIGALLWDIEAVFWLNVGAQVVVTSLWWSAYRRHRPVEGRVDGPDDLPSEPPDALHPAGNLPA